MLLYPEDSVSWCLLVMKLLALTHSARADPPVCKVQAPYTPGVEDPRPLAGVQGAWGMMVTWFGGTVRGRGMLDYRFRGIGVSWGMI